LFDEAPHLPNRRNPAIKYRQNRARWQILPVYKSAAPYTGLNSSRSYTSGRWRRVAAACQRWCRRQGIKSSRDSLTVTVGLSGTYGLQGSHTSAVHLTQLLTVVRTQWSISHIIWSRLCLLGVSFSVCVSESNFA